MSDDERGSMESPRFDREMRALTFADVKSLRFLVDFLERNREWMMSHVYKSGSVILDFDEIAPPPLFAVPDVTIADPMNKGKCTVKPLILPSVKPGSKIVFQNDTDAPVRIDFDGGNTVNPNPLTIPAGKIGVATIAQEVDALPFECKYKVDCSGNGGGPRMIIEDPEDDT